MKKKPAKTPNPARPNRGKDKFSATEVGTLIEEFRGQLTVFGERQEAVIEKLDATHEQVGRNAQEIGVLKVAVKNITAKLETLTDKVDKNTEAIAVLSQKVDKNTEAIAALIKSIDNLAKTKADREDFLTLEKRVTSLEAKVTALAK